MSIKYIKPKILSLFKKRDRGALYLHRPEALDQFLNDDNNFFLVSFPRTGSHWLRLLIENYFERPLLTRTFVYYDKDDYLLYHTHDMDLLFLAANVIYLHRNAVDTIYSQMTFKKEDLSNIERIRFWAKKYGQHLDKWLFKEDFTQKKLIITYEGLKHTPNETFLKISKYFDYDFNPARFQLVRDLVSKKYVKNSTKHDKKVVRLNTKYLIQRETFQNEYSDVIYKEIGKINFSLVKYLRSEV